MKWHDGFFFFFQAEDGIRDDLVTGVQTCALPIYGAGGVQEREKHATDTKEIHGVFLQTTAEEKHGCGAGEWEERDEPEMGEEVDLGGRRIIRSEEHTSELQSPDHLVCRLLLEKKKIDAIVT